MITPLLSPEELVLLGVASGCCVAMSIAAVVVAFEVHALAKTVAAMLERRVMGGGQ